jgi:hypothetical protein
MHGLALAPSAHPLRVSAVHRLNVPPIILSHARKVIAWNASRHLESAGRSWHSSTFRRVAPRLPFLGISGRSVELVMSFLEQALIGRHLS